MYSILHIPSGRILPRVDCRFHRAENNVYDLLLADSFYSVKDCNTFIKNFIVYDQFQRDIEDIINYKWLRKHNRFTYSQYRVVYDRIESKPYNPTFFSKEEFLIIKLNKGFGRIWTEFQP